MPDNHDLATVQHKGLAPQLSNVATQFLNGTGAYSKPTTSLSGTTTNDNATAGDIGEYVAASLGSADAVTLTTDTTADITSISLTAGDWDVSGESQSNDDATTNSTVLQTGISQVSATLGSLGNVTTVAHFFGSSGRLLGAVISHSQIVGPTRISIAVTTNVYLVTRRTFTISTAKAWGSIRARRVR